MAFDPSNGRRVELARDLMHAFVVRTGVTGDARPRRYLWTDAFAVCNLLGLATALGDARYRELARRLIDQVHFVLGRHRDDDPRKGWISGLDEHTGAQHPTAGGLRIGKPLPERAADEPFDERLEWERDGQYFHYLTKWVHALNVASRVLGDATLRRWGRELLEAAAGRFIVAAGGTTRMAWKMSIDLGRPLVPSMGHHDPLDGQVRALELQACAIAAGEPDAADRMATLAARFARMVHRDGLTTTDSLGLGGLLMDATALAEVIDSEHIRDDGLLAALLDAAAAGIGVFERGRDLRLPATHRLAFRELGLAIGLHGVPVIAARVEAEQGAFADAPAIAVRLDRLQSAIRLGRTVETFWSTPAHRDTRTWSEHADINDVMLATALVPEGFLSG